MIEIRLPFPPSANNLHDNVKEDRDSVRAATSLRAYSNRRKRGGRVTSKEYLQWQHDAGWELNKQRPKRVTERCEIKIDLDDSRNGDAANREKAVVDLLVTHGVLAGDSKKHLKRVSIGWERVTGCRVVIQPCGEGGSDVGMD